MGICYLFLDIRLVLPYLGISNQSSRSAKRLAKIQEIQQMFNSLIEHKSRKKSRNSSIDGDLDIKDSLSTVLFETNDVPYDYNNGQKTTQGVEKLPEILDGIKMTTSKQGLSTGKSKLFKWDGTYSFRIKS